MRWTTFVLLWLASFSAMVFAAEPAKPAATAADWASNPDQALAAVIALAQALISLKEGIGWAGWILGGLTVITAIGRFVPGAGGMILGVAHKILADRQTREAEAARKIQAEGFKFLVDLIEQVPDDGKLADLKDKAARKMPDAVKQAVAAAIEAKAI